MLLAAAVALPGHGNLSFLQEINGEKRQKRKKGYRLTQMKLSVLLLYDVYGTLMCLAIIK